MYRSDSGRLSGSVPTELAEVGSHRLESIDGIMSLVVGPVTCCAGFEKCALVLILTFEELEVLC